MLEIILYMCCHEKHCTSWLLLQVMFENYQFGGVYIAIQAVLTLYAQGKSSPAAMEFHSFHTTLFILGLSSHHSTTNSFALIER